jgi:hypothetical protein
MGKMSKCTYARVPTAESPVEVDGWTSTVVQSSTSHCRRSRERPDDDLFLPPGRPNETLVRCRERAGLTFIGGREWCSVAGLW